MFGNAKDKRTRSQEMKEMCNEHGICIISSVPYSLASNSIVEGLVSVAQMALKPCYKTQAFCIDFRQRQGLLSLCNMTPPTADGGWTPYKCFYSMIPDVSHIHPSRRIVFITLPKELLGKLDEQVDMGYMLRYNHNSVYWVWIPKVNHNHAATTRLAH